MINHITLIQQFMTLSGLRPNRQLAISQIIPNIILIIDSCLIKKDFIFTLDFFIISSFISIEEVIRSTRLMLKRSIDPNFWIETGRNAGENAWAEIQDASTRSCPGPVPRRCSAPFPSRAGFCSSPAP